MIRVPKSPYQTRIPLPYIRGTAPIVVSNSIPLLEWAIECVNLGDALFLAKNADYVPSEERKKALTDLKNRLFVEELVQAMTQPIKD